MSRTPPLIDARDETAAVAVSPPTPRTGAVHGGLAVRLWSPRREGVHTPRPDAGPQRLRRPGPELHRTTPETDHLSRRHLHRHPQLGSSSDRRHGDENWQRGHCQRQEHHYRRQSQRCSYFINADPQYPSLAEEDIS